MRFPWLQVDADFIGAHAGDLGAHLGISRREAMGLALDLWTWALARAGDDAPPDGLVAGTGPVPDRLLAGSVGWTGPAEEFSAALVAVGLAVRVADGYRLTGFGRYRATWEKNRRRSGGKPERNRTGTGEEPARKTQTQKEEETSPAVADAPPAAALELVPVEPPKRKPGKSNACGEFIDWFRAETRKQLAADAPDNCRMETHQAARLGEAVKLHGLETCKAAVALWMGWEGSRAAGYPLGMFAAKWEGWVLRVKAPATPAATTPKGSPDDERARALREAVAAARAKAAGGAS